uniref:Uncharacterized protein n=1 Tax=Anguilla anguilla TaxID=7936 RepID=A0A0E9TDQ4_ANGAN
MNLYIYVYYCMNAIK